MNKTFTFLSLLILLVIGGSSRLTAQVYFINETFGTATGTTPPSGWTNNTLAGDPGFDKWRFNNPAGRVANAPMSSPFAVFDSDNYSSAGGAEDVTLESPAFNTTGYAGVTLKWDQYFQTGFGGRATVEVWDGTTWVAVYDNSTTTTANPNNQTINITSQAANKTGIKVRFRWRGNYSWWWIIDNVQVYYVVDVQTTAVKSPTNMCGGANEPIVVEIKNNSAFAVSNIPVTVQASGLISGTQTRTLTRSIPALSSDTVTFPGGSTLAGGNITVKAWTALAGDNTRANDTVNYSATLVGTPSNPTNIVGATNCGPGKVNISAKGVAAQDSLYWFAGPSTTTVLGTGQNFATPFVPSTTNFYVEARRGGLGATVSTIYPAGNGNQGAMFDVISTNPATLDSISMFLGAAGSYTIRVHYKVGTYSGFETNSGAWTTLGDFAATAVGTTGPNTKFDVTNLNLAPGTTYGFYLYIVSGASTTVNYTNGTNSYSSAGITINTGVGIGGYFASFNASRTWNGALHFGGGCASNRVPVPVTINPVPRGVTLNPIIPSKSFYNGGNIASPDVVATPDSATYEIVTPNGFQSNQYGTSGTWYISSVTVKTVNGATYPSNKWKLDNPGANNGKFHVFPDTTFNDSALRVTMVVKRTDNGCDTTIERIIYVAPRPKASFTNANVCDGDLTPFTNTSTIQVGNLTYSWNFGGGNTSTRTNPSFKFPTYGNHVVKLYVTSDQGYKDSAVKTITVYQLPDPGFNFVNACEGTALTFTDNSFLPAGTPTFEWNFGDNSTGTGANTSKMYAQPGIYNVTHSVTVNGCKTSTSKYVTQAPRAVPSFNFTATQCDNKDVTFTSTSVDPAFGSVSYLWDFGDLSQQSGSPMAMHTYNAFNVYNVKLHAITDLGCHDSAMKSVTLKESPNANFTLGKPSFCTNDLINFTNTSTTPVASTNTYEWDFGDANTSTIDNPTHGYVSPGVKMATLKVMSSNGCSDQVTLPVTVNTKPTAEFYANPVCLGTQTEFVNSSFTTDNTSLTYKWNLGGTDSSTVMNPVKTFATSGVQNVTLTVVSSNGCEAVLNKTTEIYPAPVMDMIIQSQLSFDGGFNFATNATGANYLWLFGDGGSSTSKTASYKYAIDGYYIVRLAVTTDKGCSGVASDTIWVARLGVNDVTGLESSVKLYPNPGTGNFTLEFNGIADGEIKAITVLNNLGQVVKTLDMSAVADARLGVNISDEAAGIYYIQVEAAGKVSSFKYNLVK